MAPLRALGSAARAHRRIFGPIGSVGERLGAKFRRGRAHHDRVKHRLEALGRRAQRAKLW